MRNEENRYYAEEHYVLATGFEGAKRLRLHQAVYGKSTELMFHELNICPGMSVADIGCGVGFVSFQLGEFVSVTGNVTGVDISMEQLDVAKQYARQRQLTNVHFIKADVYQTGLPRSCFDLVYCRSLLSHLSRPEDALHEMNELVKPGGLLLCEDIDMESVYTQPTTTEYRRVTELMLALGHVRGADYRIGARLPDLFKSLGYADILVKTDQPIFDGGETKRYWEYTFVEVLPAMIDSGCVDTKEIDSLLPALEYIGKNDSISIALPKKWQVCGIRKKAGTAS